MNNLLIISDVIDFYNNKLKVKFNCVKYVYNNLIPEKENYEIELNFNQFWRTYKGSLNLEFCHDYIQWMFPLPEESLFNDNAPILLKDDIDYFKNSFFLKQKLFLSFKNFINFYGFNIIKNNIYPPTNKYFNFVNKNLYWLNKGNHNFLRFSRVLRCLTLCGMRDISENFFEALTKLYEKYPDIIGEKTYKYWQHAVDGKIYQK